MKHSERARVAPLYLTFTHPFRTQEIMHKQPPAVAACGGGLRPPFAMLPLATLPLGTLPLDTLPLDTLPLDTLPLATLPSARPPPQAAAHPAARPAAHPAAHRLRRRLLAAACGRLALLFEVAMRCLASDGEGDLWSAVFVT